jgi:hypothetical protein
MESFLDSLLSHFLFWKLVVMVAVVAVVSFINGYRERLGRPPLWPQQMRPRTEPDQATSPPK